jgi:hypothetical protein
LTSTPTLDFARFANTWKQYHNETYGITFEYPALYDEAPYQAYGCNIRLSTSKSGVYIDVGERISVSIENAPQQTLGAYVEAFIQDNAGPDFTVTSRENGRVGGVQAIAVEYRFGA